MGEGAGTPSAYDVCVAAIDRTDRMLSNGIITTGEYEYRVVDLLGDYFEDEAVDDDVDFLIAYARDAIDRRCDDPMHGDRRATDRFNVFLQRYLHLPAARAELRGILDGARDDIGNGHPDGLATLVDLCRNGQAAHPRIFIFESLVDETIDTARELGAVDALVAAVDPRCHNRRQLGHPNVHGGKPRRRVFEALADVATRPGSVGGQAVDALVHLCRFIQTAALASVHLPAYRLDRTQRAALLDAAEAIDDLVANETLWLPAYNASAARHAIRSVLWLANDAARINP